MAMTGVLSLCIIFAMFSSINAAGGSCYAPPLFYGPKCHSNTAIFGRPGHRVRYTINPINRFGTLICCQVSACGPAGSQTCKSFRLYNIGCSNKELSAIVPWGNNLAKPAIRCKGTPFGTVVRWSH